MSVSTESPVVVKLGGSLLSNPADGRLRAWCTLLTGELAGRCAIMPGGGTLADAVRAAHAAWPFSDLVAHRMALLSLNQCGLMLCDLFPALVAADSEAAVLDACRRGATPVWLPSKRLDTSLEVPRNWQTTSDSLAVWLGLQIGSPTVVLVKSCPVPDAPLSALSDAGIIDRYVPRIAADSGMDVRVVEADAWRQPSWLHPRK